MLVNIIMIVVGIVFSCIFVGLLRGMLVFFCHDTNNLLDKNLGHAARLAHIGTQRKRCLHTKTPPMSC